MKMIVGLGNPGKPYERNRHNVGFHCVDLLAEQHGLRFDLRKGRALAALGIVRLTAAQSAQPTGASATPPAGPEVSAPSEVTCRLLLVKPQTFMNVAGRSVAALAHFYKTPPGNILVIFDDLDLPLGKLRLRPSGGSGGHNGMKSTIQQLGSNDFPRLRIGIDRPPGRMDPAAYVLQDFSPAEEEIISQVRELAVTACEHWLVYGIDSAMNTFNSQSVS